MKRLLLIINPKAGTKDGEKSLADICSEFCKADYETVVAVTQEAGDGRVIAKERVKDFDVVVASGGDGTFNEVASGVIESRVNIPIGYLPAGTTNDFAQGIGLSSDLGQAAIDVTTGKQRTLDVGCFNGRYFSYVASFGIFSSTSYEVPQKLKNRLGHLAYTLSSVKDMITLASKIVHVKITSGEDVYEDEYIFGAISNSTSMGGVLKLKEEDVDLNDGMLEVLLVKAPKNMLELTQILNDLLTQKYMESDYITFFSTPKVKVEAPADMPWTLDGEYQAGSADIIVENAKSAIDVIVPEIPNKYEESEEE